ncbi:MAG: hypothetical protein LBH73_03400 [Spirochaetaceae bacterium]|jgi:hypothetical protein|nr:hypothetical protein [Spirochaetaceae bacterium]
MFKQISAARNLRRKSLWPIWALSVLFLGTLFFAGCEQPSGGGANTVIRIDDATGLLIETVDDLKAIGKDSVSLTKTYVLGANLELKDWTPICNKDDPFSGSLNGGGYTITLKSFDPSVVSANTYLGIFGYVKGNGSVSALIKNLKIVSEINQSSTNTGGQAIGVLAGFAENTEFSNIALSGDFEFTTDKNTYFGGVVGYAQKGVSLTNSTTSMTMKVDGGNGGGLIGGMYYNYAGGLVGAFKDGVEITACHNTGDISADCTTTGSQVFCGGIAGGSYYTFTTVYQGKIEDCSSTGNIIAKCKGFWSWAGGIAGCLVGDGDGTLEKTTRIVRCWASGTVSVKDTGAGFPYVGGIVGYNYYGALVSQCYFTGAVIADKANDYTGGIAGYNSKNDGHNSRIEDCWSGGTVTGFNNAGGIVGQNQVNTFVRRCYSIAFVKASGAGSTGVGGIAGMNASVEANAISGCVALNPSIEAGNANNIHRIVGGGSSTQHSNNHAWSNMAVNPGSGTYTPDKTINGKDGANCTEKKPGIELYRDTLGWDFTTVWKWGTNGYPILQWQS